MKKSEHCSFIELITLPAFSDVSLATGYEHSQSCSHDPLEGQHCKIATVEIKHDIADSYMALP